MALTIEEAKELLKDSTRHELRDHAFGDREITWSNEAGDTVADGYDGSAELIVYIQGQEFKGQEASSLLELGKKGQIERNDSTGPDEYKTGQIMPRLTLDGVAEELFMDKCRDSE